MISTIKSIILDFAVGLFLSLVFIFLRDLIKFKT